MEKIEFISNDDKQLFENKGEPPVCEAPDETQPAYIGIPFSIDIIISDPDGEITEVEVVNFPPWASLNMLTELPAADAIASISGSPGPDDEGFYDMSIVATDNDGNQTTSSLKIKVTDYGFSDDPPGVA
ncbi:Ig domain-containing protein [Desulfoscipio gibsoniae]|uniref:Dystroglycan-type cadherin-like domain-containing protein n=1 Tax=Desulfoscipio gibsoniae DSM 7213 TaxID=767817 RepID=R4KT51_9FIRM|nr:Ig domain-containing protein [Desulfoscipio gibsoniae]AGL02776.1 hypothetical protein Desgi_3433 [Desulfoscipio gibsoniae DSM 7213]